MISRSSKVTGKYNNEWNVKLGDNSIKQIDFNRDVASFETAPSIKTNIQHEPQGILLSKVYITKIENLATTDKLKELENWIKQEAYISVR